MKSLQVELGERSYPIYIGHELLAKQELFAPHIRGQQVMIVTNETVGPLYLKRLQTTLAAYHVKTVILPDGEQYKTLDVMNRIITAMLEARFDRHATLIALGGGVVGDITGFAAACYQRGVDCIQVPTTLLAQVDSSVGGKTAVNHALGKNMIGAFYQPRCVIADTGTLDTLDDRQLSTGFAEIIKYGLIRDAEFYAWLEAHVHDILQRDPAALAECIQRSCTNKADIVAEDERESGVRALLNLGHTFGHAIETGLGYGQWLHGEAVAAGHSMAADLSCRIGWIASVDVQRIRDLLVSARLPVLAPAELSPGRMRELMALDKKTQAGRVRLVLLKAIGHAIVASDYDHHALNETLLQCQAHSQPA